MTENITGTQQDLAHTKNDMKKVRTCVDHMNAITNDRTVYVYYPWRLEACKQVYTPRGVEQVTDVTGLPGIIICKAL